MSISAEQVHQIIQSLEKKRTIAIQNETRRSGLNKRQEEIMSNLHGMGFVSTDSASMIAELTQAAEKTVGEIKELIPDV